MPARQDGKSTSPALVKSKMVYVFPLFTDIPAPPAAAVVDRP